MQLLFDFFPLIVFFVAYRLFDVYVATAAIMIAMAVQVAYQWVRHRKVNTMLLVSALLVAIFGGITLMLRNPLFIQWKVTVVNWLFALAFLGSQIFSEKTLTQRVMGHAIELEPALWRQLNTIWVLNFAVIGALNLFVMYNYDEATWVYFKSWGMIGLSLITALGQAIWISARTSQQSTEKD
ncbi:MAG TPA: septation protein A [Gammaproteobacteria bacterium]|nr:septation protein A [Gammaproteobacteria bacterium]